MDLLGSLISALASSVGFCKVRCGDDRSCGEMKIREIKVEKLGGGRKDER